MKLLTKEQVQKQYKNKYIDVYATWDYKTRQNMYEVRHVYNEIHENTTRGEDVGTDNEYMR